MTGLKGLTVQDGHVRCEQEVGTGRDVYVVPLPAVVTVKEGINLPRYPSVPAKLRARRKPIERARAGGRARRGSRWCGSRCRSGRGRAGRGARRGAGGGARRGRASWRLGVA